MMKQLLFVLLLCSTVHASPVLLDSVETNNSDGTATWQTQSGGWWLDDFGVIQRTDSSLKAADGVWAIQNTSAPHRIYAATDEVRWRVDPPSGEAAGFEIEFSTVSLYLFDEVNGDVEKTINWAPANLNTSYDGTAIHYQLFSDCSLYVISTPEGYKTNFYLSSPSSIPSPTDAAFFGPDVDLSKVYFAARYSVSKWPDSAMLVDGEEYGPGSIIDGYSATFGDDLWMLPTKCYRNVTEFDGVSWRETEDWSYVYYVFDRLAQEIFVLAPYMLIQGATNVLIDPTTWTSGRTSSDDATWITSNLATTNFGTDNFVNIGYNSSTERHGLFRFASVPSVASIRSVSATLILFYNGTQYNTNTIPTYITRLLRPWIEGQATYNVYSTSNNWGTAGANNSTTDYDGANIISYSWNDTSNIVLSNNAVFNSWCESWILGTATNNGINIFRNGSTANEFREVWSDDYATVSGRPYLVITYNTSSTFLSWTDIDVRCVGSGGMVGASIICPATTTYLALADVVRDVTGLASTPVGTTFVIGEGPEADYNWNYTAAVNTIKGATAFILGASVGLELPTQVSLYLKSGETGATDERYFQLDWGGGSSGGSTDVLDAIDDLSTDVLTNRAIVWAVTPGLNTRIQSATGDVRASWPMIASVSTQVQSTESNLSVEHVALGIGIENASITVDAHLDAVAADVDILKASADFLSNNVKVSRAYYNTDTALTNGEFLRDVPANALSHVESRWLPVADVIAENWGAYVKREFVIYSYPDSAAGTTLASHLIPSSTAPTERTWTDKGASLW